MPSIATAICRRIHVGAAVAAAWSSKMPTIEGNEARGVELLSSMSRARRNTSWSRTASSASSGWPQLRERRGNLHGRARPETEILTVPFGARGRLAQRHLAAEDGLTENRAVAPRIALPSLIAETTYSRKSYDSRAGMSKPSSHQNGVPISILLSAKHIRSRFPPARCCKGSPQLSCSSIRSHLFSSKQDGHDPSHHLYAVTRARPSN